MKKKTVSKAIVLCGGLGPMAGVELHKRIIEHTKTNGTDQEHLTVYHISAGSEIQDRTKFLLSRKGENPGIELAKILIELAPMIERHNNKVVLSVACNTFHASAIWSEFSHRICERFPGIELISIEDATITYITEGFPAARTVGVMSTKGARRSGVFREKLAKAGLKVIEPEEGMQELLHSIINDPTYGLKAKNPPSTQAIKVIRKVANHLLSNEAELIVMGCTELSLASEFDQNLAIPPFIDSVNVLAKEVVHAAMNLSSKE